MRKLPKPPTGSDGKSTVYLQIPSTALEVVDALANREIRSRASTVAILVVEALQARGLIAKTEGAA